MALLTKPNEFKSGAALRSVTDYITIMDTREIFLTSQRQILMPTKKFTYLFC
jgi:hypothetical protein